MSDNEKYIVIQLLASPDMRTLSLVLNCEEPMDSEDVQQALVAYVEASMDKEEDDDGEIVN